MIESIIVAAIICGTLLLLAAIGAWAATMPVRQKMKIENAQLEMNKELHQINIEKQRSLASLELQRNLLALERGENLPSPVETDIVKEFKSRTEKVNWK